MWLEFVNTRTEIRNDLTIFLRDTQHLSDICNLLWLGPVLLGIHLTEPYLALLIDRQATHLELLTILPELYKELSEYKISLAQIKKAALPSLRDVWVDPRSYHAPYNKEIGSIMSRAIERCNKELLDCYRKELCAEIATILKRQRGNTYNFGDDENSTELVTSQFSEDELKDSILTRFGAQSFEKSTDDLILKYSHDLLPESTVWCTAKARRSSKNVRLLQQGFNAKQDALLKARVAKSDADVLAKETQIQKFVQQFRCVKALHGAFPSLTWEVVF